MTTARRTGNGRIKGKLKEGSKFSHLLLNSGRVGQEAGVEGRIRHRRKAKKASMLTRKEHGQNQAKLRTDML